MMKRLLAYLFIVLGLGIYFNDHAQAKNISSGIWSTFEEKTKINLPKILKKKETNTQVFNVNDDALKINPTYLKSLNYEEKIKLSKSLYKSANKNFKQKKIIRGCSELYQMSILNAMNDKLFKRAKKRVNKYNCTQYNFASLELNSENIKNAEIICATKSGFSEYRISEDVCNSNENQILNGTDDYYKVLAFIENKILSKPIKNVNRNYVCSIWQASSFKIVNYIDETSRCTDIFYEDSHQDNYKIFSKYINNVISNDKYTSLKVSTNNLIVKKDANKDNLIEEPDKLKALISKAKNPEPGTYSFGDSDVIVANTISNTVKGCWSIPMGLPANEKNLMVRIKLKLRSNGSVAKSEIVDHQRMNKPGQGFYKVLAESALRAVKLCSPFNVKVANNQEILLNFDARNILFGTPSIEDKKTEIAKAEPTIIPKKKKEVAKIEKPKTEEFKPENKDIDNDAPVIEIAQNIIVDSQTYTLKGKVKDKSKLYLEANGRPLKISKRGNFELEGFVVDPDAGDKIKIVAIDQWKNKSEKTINIKVEFKEIAELRSYEKPNPSKIKVKQDKNKIAIIIGIEKYKTLKNIDAPYANRDANAFRAYANRALGIPNKNIKVLIDENATRGETLKALTLWLPQIARGKNKDIYVFFAGHGLASDDGKNLYILPQDGDAALLQYTALSRLEIFDLINRVEPKSVTMFFDTCYSGQTRDERMLVAGLRPIRLVAEEQEVQNNFTIFTASNYDQTSGSIEEAKHGIFSYYLMMGMQGKADTNQDKKITNGELIAYLKQNVSEEAFINNRQQEPMLSGDPDKVLISYR